MELVVWANNRATCGATRCASRCSGWQGRSAAGVTIPRVSVVKGGRGFALGRRGARGFCSPDVDPRPIDRSRTFPETRPRKLRSRPASRKCLLFFPGEIPGKTPGLSSPPPSAPRSSMTDDGAGERVGESRGGTTPHCGGEGQEDAGPFKRRIRQNLAWTRDSDPVGRWPPTGTPWSLNANGELARRGLFRFDSVFTAAKIFILVVRVGGRG